MSHGCTALIRARTAWTLQLGPRVSEERHGGTGSGP
jgi:hypothetical protein